MEKTNFPVEEPAIVVRISDPEAEEEKIEISFAGNTERCKGCGVSGGIIRETHCTTCLNCGWSSCEIW